VAASFSANLEKLFATLERELLDGAVFASRPQAANALAECVEVPTGDIVAHAFDFRWGAEAPAKGSTPLPVFFA